MSCGFCQRVRNTLGIGVARLPTTFRFAQPKSPTKQSSIASLNRAGRSDILLRRSESRGTTHAHPSE
jgi:hypothetical protein